MSLVALSMLTAILAADPAVGAPPGVSQRGTRGVERVEAALALSPGDLVLGVQYRYFTASELVGEAGRYSRSSEDLTVTWAPLAGLELTLGHGFVSAHDDALSPASSHTFGDPRVGLKLTHALSQSFGLGGGLSALFPARPGSAVPHFDAAVVSAYAAASYVLSPAIVASVNAGYIFDRSGRLQDGALSAAQRFAGNLSRANLATAGVGISTAWYVGKEARLGPFAEVTLGLALGSPAVEWPGRATLGLLATPFGDDVIDLVVGSDIRFLGAPSTDPRAELPGLPPWEAFGRLAVHISPPPPPAPVIAPGPPPCTGDTSCHEGEACSSGVCRKILVKELVREVPTPLPTFVIEGAVHDAATGKPVDGATIVIAGIEASALAVDFNTGAFRSYPVPAGEGLLQVKAQATGYGPAVQTLERGASGEVKILSFELTRSGEAQGQLKGTLKDARSGRPLVGAQIFIPALGQKIVTKAEGAFEATVKAGRYPVLISVPGRRYVTQRKDVEIGAGDVVILNVDMTRARD